MCLGICRRIINPGAHLEKMLTFLRVIIIINLIIPILRILTDNYDDLINDLLCVFILWAATESCHFLIAGFFIMIVIINNLISFFLIGAYIQAILQGAILNSSHILFLCINIFIFLFYAFVVVIVFPAYEEMKAVFMESVGLRANQDMEANLRPVGNSSDLHHRGSAASNVNNFGSGGNAPSAEENQQNFVPFAGRGVQLG